MGKKVTEKQDKKHEANDRNISNQQSNHKPSTHFVDNRPEAVAQRKFQKMADNSPQVLQMQKWQAMANQSLASPPIQKKEKIIQRRKIMSDATLEHYVDTTRGQTGNAGLTVLAVLKEIADFSGVPVPRGATETTLKILLKTHGLLDNEDIQFIQLRVRAVARAHADAQQQAHNNQAAHFDARKQGYGRLLTLSNNDPRIFQILDFAHNDLQATEQINATLNQFPDLRILTTNHQSNLALWHNCMQAIGPLGTQNLLGWMTIAELLHYNGLAHGLYLLDALITNGVNQAKIKALIGELTFLGAFAADPADRTALADWLATNDSLADIKKLITFTRNDILLARQIHGEIAKLPALHVLVDDPQSNLALWHACMQAFGPAETARILPLISIPNLLLYKDANKGLDLLKGLTSHPGVDVVKLTAIAHDVNYFCAYADNKQTCADLAALVAHDPVADIKKLFQALTLVKDNQKPNELLQLFPHAADASALETGLKKGTGLGLSQVMINSTIISLPVKSKAAAINAALDLRKKARNRAEAYAQQEHADRVGKLDAQADAKKKQAEIAAEGDVELNRNERKIIAKNLTKSDDYLKLMKKIKERAKDGITKKQQDIDTQLAREKQDSAQKTMPTEADTKDQKHEAFIKKAHYYPAAFEVLDFAKGKEAKALNIIAALKAHPILQEIVDKPSLKMWDHCETVLTLASTAAILGKIDIKELTKFDEAKDGLNLLAALNAQASLVNQKIKQVAGDLGFFGSYASDAAARTTLATLLATDTVADIKDLLKAIIGLPDNDRPAKVAWLLPYAKNARDLLPGLQLAEKARLTQAQVDGIFKGGNVIHHKRNYNHQNKTTTYIPQTTTMPAIPQKSNAVTIKDRIAKYTLVHFDKEKTDKGFVGWIHAADALMTHAGFTITSSAYTTLTNNNPNSVRTDEAVSTVKDAAGNFKGDFVVHKHPGVGSATVNNRGASKEHIKENRHAKLHMDWDGIPSEVRKALP